MSVRAVTPRLFFGEGDIDVDVVRLSGIASSVVAVNSTTGPPVLVPDRITAKRVLSQLGLSRSESRFLVETAVLVE